jgi:hypothetical protein
MSHKSLLNQKDLLLDSIQIRHVEIDEKEII